MAKVRKAGAAQGNQVSQQTGAILLEQHKPETEAGGNERWKGGQHLGERTSSSL